MDTRTGHRRFRNVIGVAVATLAIGTAGAGAAAAAEEPSPRWLGHEVERQVLDLLAPSPTIPSSLEPLALHRTIAIGEGAGVDATVKPLPEELCDVLGDSFPDWLCGDDVIDPSTGTGPFDPTTAPASGTYGGTLVAEVPGNPTAKAQFELGCKVDAKGGTGQGTSWTGSCGFTVKFGRSSATVQPVLTTRDGGTAQAAIPWGAIIDFVLELLDDTDPGGGTTPGSGGGDSGGGSSGGSGPGYPVPDCHVVVQCG